MKVHVGGCRAHAMHGSPVSESSPMMHFHPKMPLVSLLRLTEAVPVSLCTEPFFVEDGACGDDAGDTRDRGQAGGE